MPRLASARDDRARPTSSRARAIVLCACALAALLVADCRLPKLIVALRGPGGGGALFWPAISPHHPDEIWMASDMTDAYRSRDFGRHWTTIPFRVLQGGANMQLRFTADPRVLYAIAQASERTATTLPTRDPLTLAKSIDGGRTWDAPVRFPGTPNAAYSLFVDPHRSDRLLTSDFARLYFSCDGGLSFRLVHTTAWQGGLVVAGAFWSGADVYVATNDGMLVSHDGGATFAIDPAFVGIRDGEGIVSFAGATDGATTRFYAVTFRTRDAGGAPIVAADVNGLSVDAFAGLYRLTLPRDPSAARTWEPLDDRLEPGQKLSVVATSDVDPDVAYAGGGQRLDPKTPPIVLATRDGGASWQSVLRTAHNANVATGWSGEGGDMGWVFGELVLGLAVAPGDPRRVVMTDMGFVHVTEDGGATWRQAYVLPRDENPPGHDTPPSRAYRTSGVEPISGWWLTFVDRRTIFASLTDVRSARSTDGGETWARSGRDGLSMNTTYHVVRQPRTGALFAAIASIHDLYERPYLRDSMIDHGRGAVMRSDDGGASWTLVRDMGHPVIWLALDPHDEDALYASVVHGVDGGVYRLDLAHPADPPTKLPPPPRTKGHAFNVHVLDDGAIVATYSGHQDEIGDTRVFRDRSGVFYLPRGGAAWEDRSDPTMRFWTKDLVVDPHDPTQRTWYVAVFSPEVGASPTHSGGLYRTRDRGRTWRRVFDDYRVESCAIDPRDARRMLVATEHHGLFLTEELDAPRPRFAPIERFPFRQPTRIFFDPYDADRAWVLTFGGGIYLLRASDAATADDERAD